MYNPDKFRAAGPLPAVQNSCMEFEARRWLHQLEVKNGAGQGLESTALLSNGLPFNQVPSQHTKHEIIHHQVKLLETLCKWSCNDRSGATR